MLIHKFLKAKGKRARDYLIVLNFRHTKTSRAFSLKILSFCLSVFHSTWEPEKIEMCSMEYNWVAFICWCHADFCICAFKMTLSCEKWGQSPIALDNRIEMRLSSFMNQTFYYFELFLCHYYHSMIQCFQTLIKWSIINFSCIFVPVVTKTEPIIQKLLFIISKFTSYI